MDKTEYKMKLEEINRLVENDEYIEALEIVESIDWRRVKSVRTLTLVAEIYEANQEYAAAKDILLMALDKTTIGKSIIYELVSVCIALEEYDEAVEYYSEFIKIAPNDNTKYILKYKIYKARKSPVQEQIAILEEYKSYEYTEKWSYELAKLYQKADMIEKCIEECDDLILWFSEGKYVIKALELKKKYASLTPSQKQTYENRYKKKIEDKTEEQREEKIPNVVSTSDENEEVAMEDDSLQSQPPVEAEPPVKKPVYVPTVENTVGIQDKLVKGIRSVFSRNDDDMDDDSSYDEEDIFEETVTEELDNENDYDVVKELEPEKIQLSDIKPFTVSTRAEEPKVEENKAVEVEEPKAEENKPTKVEDKVEELDLEALIAETTNSLANEVAKGSYEKVEQLEDEKKQSATELEEKEDLGLTKEFDFDKDIKILRAKEAAKQLKETIAAAKNKENELAKRKQQEKVEVETFKLPPDILEEIEAKKRRVLEEIPVMQAPVVDDFVMVPKDERELVESEEPEDTEELVIDMQLPKEEFIDELKKEDLIEIPEDIEVGNEVWRDSENLEKEEEEAAKREEDIFKNLTMNLENVIEQAIAEQKEEIEKKEELEEKENFEEAVKEASSELEVLEEPSIEIKVEEEEIPEVMEEPSIEIKVEEEEIPEVMEEPSIEIKVEEEEIPEVMEEPSIEIKVEEEEIPEVTEEPSIEIKVEEEEIPEVMEEPSIEIKVEEEEIPEVTEEPSIEIKVEEEEIPEVMEEPSIEIKFEEIQPEMIEPEMIEVENIEESPLERVEEVEEEELPELEGRRFDSEEKRIFTYFATIPGIDDQVTKALEAIRRSSYSQTSKRGNVVIMGRHESGKTRLSNALIIAACRTLGLEASKIAHVDASDMNAGNPASIIAKLSGGFLVIERAGYMNDETLEKLSKAMELKTDSLTVILEGDKDNMRRMLSDKNKKEIAEKFEQIIAIPVFTNDELVTFARTYAKEQGYKLDDMAVLALYTLIGDNQNDNEPVTIGKVKEMVDEAIKRAGKGTRRLSRKFSKRQNDNDARIIIYEKDFHL